MKNGISFFLVSLLMPGMGYLLLGQSKNMYATLFAFYMTVGLASVLHLYPTFSGFLSVSIVMCTLHLGTAMHAAFAQERPRIYATKGILKWAFTIAFFLLTITGFGNSQSTMGFDRLSMDVPVMAPEIMKDEQVLVDTRAYDSEGPKRGDIIIHSFKGQDGVFLNRVAALGGETIEISAGKVFINGIITEEDYVRSENAMMPESMNMPLTVVPLDGYFVMGDNRDRSLGDSRFSGPIRSTDIKGKVTYILYSRALHRIGKRLTR